MPKGIKSSKILAELILGVNTRQTTAYGMASPAFGSRKVQSLTTGTQLRLQGSGAVVYLVLGSQVLSAAVIKECLQ
jgi:hypothetical protein